MSAAVTDAVIGRCQELSREECEHFLEKGYVRIARAFRGTLGGLPKVYPNALAGARGGAGGFSCLHTSAHDQGRHPPSAVWQTDV